MVENLIMKYNLEHFVMLMDTAQQEDMDFDETYAPVARFESIRILLAYAHDFKLFLMEVKSAFLNGFINEKGLWYPKGTGIETIVYADFDHAGDYVHRKSTSGVCTFMGCCLTSWFSKKQIALAISTTEAEYISAEKAFQQALWMKQALVDYDIVLDDIPVLCDNKGAIDLRKAAQEEASRVAIMKMFDEVQVGINADALFAAKLQQKEREEYTIEERAKFLAKTIAAQRKFRAAQRSAEIRSRPPTKGQLTNLIMTYLKNMGGYKHSQLKSNTFEEIQGMYEREKKRIDDFKPMDSDDAVKDSKKAPSEYTSKKEEVLKEPNSTKVEVKLKAADQGTKKIPGKITKMKARKKAGKQTHANDDQSFDEEERNKKDEVESSEKGADASKKRKGGPRMKRQSKRKKTNMFILNP
ncbi:copia protein [Tanacetum coccineum]|uniref:Copia protein n=1 Tax=Tanacetum coccineum TaxID=301880 RepID=A0ABQ5FJG4_9ASTR